MKNYKRITCILILLTAVACNLATPAGSSGLPTQTAAVKGRCGDGACTQPENASMCPADCGGETAPADASKPVLYYGIMVHLEGWDDARDKGSFEKHAELVRRYASLFETYGARLTLESKEFTDGCIAWGENVLKEMEDRGHGIGVHADIGGQSDMRCAEFTPLLQERKQTLESLGVQVRHASGIVSSCDWVTAAEDAGFLFTSGTVAYALMSLPLELRPAGYTDCPSPSKCHEAYPFDLAGRMHPWRMASGEDWILDDPEGRLVILPSGGGLTCAAEEAGLEGSYTKCEFKANDVDAVIAELESVLALVEMGTINTYYVAWSLGQALDDGLLEDFLRRVKPYVDDGRVEWKTLPEMYDLYAAWEKSLF